MLGDLDRRIGVFVRRSSSRTRERSVSVASPGGMRGARVTSHCEPAPRPAWTDVQRPVSEIHDGDFLERVLRIPLSYVDESEDRKSVV